MHCGPLAPTSRNVIAVLLLLQLGACAPDSPAPMRPVVVRRLGDEVANRMGRRTHVERIADVIRVVLPGLYSVAMLPATANVLAIDPALTKQYQLNMPSPRTPVVLPGESHVSFAPADAGTDVTFLCPSRLLGRPAVLTVDNPPDQQAGTRVAQPFHCPASPDALAHVHLPSRLDGSPVTYVRGLETAHIKTGRISLVEGARLRVTLGLIPALLDEVAAPGRFRIVAENTGGRTMVLLDRRLEPSARPEESAWVPLDLDLEPVRAALGPDVRLGFAVSADDGARQSVFPVWADLSLRSPAPREAPAAPRRNVVLVSIDTLRADRVGAYGATRPTTPQLDALAAESTLFETVIAPAPWTLPSHTSMMTGLHSCAHEMVGVVGRAFPPGLVPIAQRFRDIGYSTAAMTEDGLVDAAAFAKGFDYYWENRSGDDRVRRTVAQAEAWLSNEANEPFFLFFHTYQSHDPYFSPPEYARGRASAGGSPDARGATDVEKLDKYDAAVRYTDDAIAPLLAAIRSSPRGERTLLVLTSDHGEAFGEHGYTGHGRRLDEEVLRVPLLVWGPGLVAPGRRVAGAVGVIDITPTILDLAGMPIPPGITGVSLAPQVRADGVPPAVPERVLFSENTLQNTYRVAARWPSWKATWENGKVQIVDLTSDPGERGSAATPERESEAAAARQRFEDECARQKADLTAAGAAQPEGSPRVVDPERERQLKALGYVD
jgi:arylsulfatase A-like enzyme